MSRNLLARSLSIVLVLLFSAPAFPRCNRTIDPDKTDIANARATVAKSCPCGAATSQRDYLRCAGPAARAALNNKSCAAFVRRCAARSTCGRPGAVTCCRTDFRGTTRCSVTRAFSRCTPPRGGHACVSALSSCCDACSPTGCVVTATSTTTTTTTTTTLPRIGTVFIIMMENHDWSSIKGNVSAPYINNTLLPAYAHAENYRGGDMHPSLPNYITLEGGDDLGLAGKSPLPANFRIATTDHLTTYLNNHGIAWKSYSELLPGGGSVCAFVDGMNYSADHNSFAYFNDVTGNPPQTSNAYCKAHIRPYTEFATDLRNDTVPRYNFIIPNDLDQGEKSATSGASKVKQSDDWLSTEVPRILASAAYRRGAALFIVWDESKTHGTDVPIGCILVSSLAKHGYSNTIAYSHASTVRTVQEIFGVTPLLRKAATATDLGDLFVSFP